MYLLQLHSCSFTSLARGLLSVDLRLCRNTVFGVPLGSGTGAAGKKFRTSNDAFEPDELVTWDILDVSARLRGFAWPCVAPSLEPAQSESPTHGR